MRGRLVGHYRLLDLVGAGGMGEVYRARDERLDRDVAVKVLPEAVASNADRLARFEREAKALARIEHPNILAIHDFGRDAVDPGAPAIVYAVTELLTGETLRARLARERLSWRRAAEVGAAVADGLAAAHGQGIVHRDLKPENLFLTADGRVKILDFGLAASDVVADSAAETEPPPGGRTEPGTMLGTVGYMAPEQVQGGGVDGRADVFAFGCVLYEMATGRRAFARATATETLAAILSAPVPDLSASGSDAPLEFGRIVARCLEKQPGERFQSASDLAFALRALTTGPVSAATDTPAQEKSADRAGPGGAAGRPRSRWRAWALGGVAAIVLVAIAATASLWWRSRPASLPAAPPSGLDPDRVVVAVFANRTGDPTLEALGMQISDWVTQNLTRIAAKVAINPEVPSLGGPGLPRATLAKEANPIRALADRTGAGLVVTGAYYLEGDQLRVQSQVIDAESGAITITLPPSVGPRSAPSAVTAEVTARVMGALAVRLNKAWTSYSASGTARPPSYDAYLEFLQGVAVFGPNNVEAERRFRRSVQLDPGYTMARMFLWGLLSNEGRPAEADEIVRALEEPAAYSQATPAEQAGIRYARADLAGNLPGLVAAASDWARLAPAQGNYMLGLAERWSHRPRAALAALSRIRVEESPAEVGPTSSWFLDVRAGLHHELGEYDKEFEAARLGQQHYPGVPNFFMAEIRVVVASGRTADIDAVVARAEQAAGNPDGGGRLIYLAARELAAHGHADAARAMASRAAEHFRRRVDTDKPTPALRHLYAIALLRSGDCRQALPIRLDLARQAPDNLAYQSFYATALVSCGGSREEALKIANALATVERPFLRGAHLYYRARILAALGDGEGAVRELQAGFAKGNPWNGTEMHLDTCWDPIRAYPPFIEWMKPKG